MPDGYDGLALELNIGSPYSGPENFRTLDSSRVEGNRFFFDLDIGGISRRLASVAERGGRVVAWLVLEEGTVDLSVDSIASFSYTVSGTPANDDYYEWVVLPRKAVQQKKISNTERQQKERDFLRKYIGDPLLVDVPMANLHRLRLDGRTDDPEIDSLFALLPEDMQERISDYNERQKFVVDSIRFHKPPVEKPYPAPIAKGAKYTDGTGHTPEGKEIALSELMKGKKLVLLDFWASWCGPCIREMPEVAELYHRYKDRGFEVIGISSDSNLKNWKAAIEKYEMAWPQIVTGKEDLIGRTYHVETIPSTILIDEEGTIVARDLRRNWLADKVKELMED